MSNGEMPLPPPPPTGTTHTPTRTIPSTDLSVGLISLEVGARHRMATGQTDGQDRRGCFPAMFSQGEHPGPQLGSQWRRGQGGQDMVHKSRSPNTQPEES
ncbi:unnamed protein product [Arctogadus glacialis]